MLYGAGAANSESPDAGCRSNCRLPFCGDGVVANGEGCDDGPGNSDAPDAACRTDCTSQRCGDEVVDKHEQCEPPNLEGTGCTDQCQLVACPALALEGGTVAVSNGGTYPSTATYACEGGNPPSDGDAERMCQVDGTGAGTTPTTCAPPCAPTGTPLTPGFRTTGPDVSNGGTTWVTIRGCDCQSPRLTVKSAGSDNDQANEQVQVKINGQGQGYYLGTSATPGGQCDTVNTLLDQVDVSSLMLERNGELAIQVLCANADGANTGVGNNCGSSGTIQSAVTLEVVRKLSSCRHALKIAIRRARPRLLLHVNFYIDAPCSTMAFLRGNPPSRGGGS
jgi:hypothetical protein